MTANIADLLAIKPFLTCSIGAILVIVCDLFVSPKRSRSYLGVMTVAVFAFMFWSSYVDIGQASFTAFSDMVRIDGFSRYLTMIIALAAGLTTLVIIGRMSAHMSVRGEVYALILFSSAGAQLLTIANDFVTLFLAIECLSLPAYILAATHKGNIRSTEAGMKYFIMGSFATGFLVYGIALLYGATGTTQFSGISHYLVSTAGNLDFIFTAGMLFILIALCFKVAAVPFYLWTPDVYSGAPTPISGFFATVIKAASFGAFIRVFTLTFAAPLVEVAAIDLETWYFLIAGLSILTMTVGNLAALVQTDIKMMLAYSSIAHAGYLLMGVLAPQDGITAMLFYLMIYSFMTVGAFAIVSYFENGNDNTAIESYVAYGHSHPYAAVAMVLFMLSLAGIPPTGGFMAKFYLFRAVVQQGYIGLVVVAAINSMISAAYYLRILVAMYMTERRMDGPQPVIPFSLSVIMTVVVCSWAVLALGINPSSYLEFVKAVLKV